MLVLAAKDVKRATVEAIQRGVESHICEECAAEVDPEQIVDKLLSEMSL